MRIFAFTMLCVSVLILSMMGRAEAGAIAASEAYSSRGVQNAYEWCHRPTLAGAKSCAYNACEQIGGEECSSAEYCSPSKWAGVMTMRGKNGLLVHALVCERASRASIFVAVRKKCLEFRRKDTGNFKGCDVLTVISPDGNDTANSTHYRWRDGELQAY